MNFVNWLNEKKMVYILAAFLGITTILDIWTAFSSPVFHILETNPLYLVYGVWPLTIINFIYMVIIIRGLKKCIRLITLFGFVMACLLLSYGHLLGAASNIDATHKYYENPQKIIDFAKNVTSTQKITAYNDFVGKQILYPYILCLVGFLIIIYFYHKRKPIRDKYVDEICKLASKIREL